MSEARLRSVGPSVGLVYAYVCRWVVGGSGESAWQCPGKAFGQRWRESAGASWRCAPCTHSSLGRGRRGLGRLGV